MVVDEDFGPGEHSSSNQTYLSDKQVIDMHSCLKRNVERESRRQSQNKRNGDTLCAVLSNTISSRVWHPRSIHFPCPMFDPLLYPMNDDWLDFAVGVKSVGNTYMETRCFTRFNWSDKDVTSCNYTVENAPASKTSVNIYLPIRKQPKKELGYGERRGL